MDETTKEGEMVHSSRVRLAASRLLSVGLILAALAARLEAQPTLNVTRILSNWPSIEVYFSAKCAGKPVKFYDKSHFKVLESGIEQPFTLWCPPTTARLSISAVLLFDVSASMAGQGLPDIRMAGQAFVDKTLQGYDETAVAVFSDTASILQKFTKDKPVVRTAIDGIAAAGGTRSLWDGLIGTMQRIYSAGTANRSVIVLTSGVDSASSGTLFDVIQMANRQFFHIHVVQYGSSAGADELRMLADSTNGTFHQAGSGTDLIHRFQEIYDIEVGGYDECVITFESAVHDGSTRKVELQLQNFCSGSVSDTGTYRVPLIDAVEQSRTSPSSWNLVAYPDPTTSTATITIVGDVRECIRIRILDAAGHVLQDLGERATEPGSSAAVSLSGLPSGVYYVAGVTPSRIQVRPLIKF